MIFVRLLFLLFCGLSITVQAQPLRKPPIFPNTDTVAIDRLHTTLRDVAQSSISAAEKQAAHQRMLDEEAESLAQLSTEYGVATTHGGRRCEHARTDGLPAGSGDNPRQENAKPVFGERARAPAT